jgi:hypothetical protein
MFPSPADRGRLLAAEALAHGLRRDAQRQAPTPDGTISVKLTGYSDDLQRYAWTRVFPDDFLGDYEDDTLPLEGTVAGVDGETVTFLPAREMNSVIIRSFPYYARLRPRISNTTYGVIYEFDAGEQVYDPQGSQVTGGPVNQDASNQQFGPLVFSAKGIYLMTAHIYASGSTPSGAVNGNSLLTALVQPSAGTTIYGPGEFTSGHPMTVVRVTSATPFSSQGDITPTWLVRVAATPGNFTFRLTASGASGHSFTLGSINIAAIRLS